MAHYESVKHPLTIDAVHRIADADNLFAGERPISIADAGPSPILSVLRILGRRKWFIASTTILFAMLGSAYTLSLPKGYTARAMMIVRQPTSDPLATAGTPLPRLDDVATETATAELKAHDLLAQVVSDSDYRIGPKPPLPSIQMLCRGIDLGKACLHSPSLSLDARTEDFAAHLVIEPIGRSRALNLSFTAPTPSAAVGSLEILMDTQQRREQQQSVSHLSQTANWLDGRANELQAKWLAAERAVSEFRSRSGLTQTTSADGRGGLLKTQQLTSAASALSEAQASLAAATARAAALEQAVRTDRRVLVRMSEQPVIAAATINLNRLLAQKAQVSAQFGQSNPEVISLNRQIAQAESDLNVQIDTAMKTIRSDVAEKQVQVDFLTRSLERIRSQTDVQNGLYGDLTTLQGEADVAKVGYQSFLEHAQSYADRSQIQQTSLAVVSHASASDVPTTPASWRLIIASVLLGFTTASAIVFAREVLRKDFSNVSQAGNALGLPVLATTTLISRRRWYGQRRKIDYYPTEYPTSRAAESARLIATTIDLIAVRPTIPQVIAVTSASSAEGKSVLCMWLASVIATSNRRVLIIDGDFRSPASSLRRGTEMLPNLGKLLQGHDDLQDAIRFDTVTKVFFISSQSYAEVYGMLNPERLNSLLIALKKQFDVIIIDTPPVLALADSLMLCSVADQTLLLYRWNRTSRIAVHSCVKRLREARARITGLVVSLVPEREEMFCNDTMTHHEQMLMKKYYRD